MSSYADFSMVQGRLSNMALGPSSTPSSVQVQQFIDGRSAEIDSRLASLGYQTPITAPAELVADLAQLNAMAAAADVWSSVFVAAPGVKPQDNAAALLKEYEARLAEIMSGTSVPVGLGYTQSNRTPRSYFVDNNAIGSGLDIQDVFGNQVCADPVVRMGKIY